MKRIPDGFVDMVLCDLPYGVTQNERDVEILFKPLWEQYYRIAKENAAFVYCKRTFCVKTSCQ